VLANDIHVLISIVLFSVYGSLEPCHWIVVFTWSSGLIYGLKLTEEK